MSWLPFLAFLLLIIPRFSDIYAYNSRFIDKDLEKQIEEKFAMKRQAIVDEHNLLPRESLPHNKSDNYKILLKANNPEVSKLANKIKVDELKSNTFFRNFSDKIRITHNWLMDDFVEYASKNKKPLLDIGSGYGEASLKALKRGATVISNDIMVENLLIQVRSINNSDLLNNLYLNNSYFPLQLKMPNQSLGGVAAFRIFSFLSGHLIEESVKRMAEWISTGDKVFVMTLAPQNHFFTSLLDNYQKKLAAGEDWPGDKIITSDVLPLEGSNPPEYIHVMDEKPLRDIFEKYGFSIEKANFIQGEYTYFKETYIDEKAFFGIIAKKN